MDFHIKSPIPTSKKSLPMLQPQIFNIKYPKMNHQKEKASFLSPLLFLKKTIILGVTPKSKSLVVFGVGFFVNHSPICWGIKIWSLTVWVSLVCWCLKGVLLLLGWWGRLLMLGKNTFWKGRMVDDGGFFIWGREVSLGFCFFWKDVNWWKISNYTSVRMKRCKVEGTQLIRQTMNIIHQNDLTVTVLKSGDILYDLPPIKLA